MATLEFNRLFAKEAESFITSNPNSNLGAVYARAMRAGAMFDARAFSIPKEEVVNCLIWRQQDATRNSIEAVGQAHFSQEELHGKSCGDIQEMLWSEKGVNWNNFDIVCKRGSCCYRTSKVMTMPNPRAPGEEVTVSRSVWIVIYIGGHKFRYGGRYVCLNFCVMVLTIQVVCCWMRRNFSI